MNIVVIGGGSTGLVYGSKLSEVTQTTLVVRRQHQADLINDRGTVLERPDGSESFSLAATTDTSIIEKADLVIGLTKCYDAKSVGKLVRTNMKENCMFLCLHNGLGTIDVYNDLIGTANVIGGVTYLGANRLQDNTAKLGIGVRTVVGEQSGEITERLSKIVEIFSSAGFKAESSDSLAQLIWDKLILAVGQHALCAISGLSFKEMRESPEVLEISQALLDETEQVAEVFGIEFEDSLMERVIANLEFGADHYSSMYQDIKAGRRTEIDYINGAIAQLGVEYLIPTPVNNTIANLIRAISIQSN